jgi:hypothetical protein
MNLIVNLLNFYIWVAVITLLFFLFAIARFYERKAKRRAYYQTFLLSGFFFGVAAIRYMFVAPLVVGDIWGDSFRLAGAGILIGFGMYLLNIMTGGRS